MYIESKKISLAGAKKIADAAKNEAQRLGLPGAIAIVDDGTTP
jgi:uncharacterized protein GlcG (DUF336 family)